MKNIGELFARFKNFVPPEKILKKTIVGEIKDATGIELSLDEIEIAKGIVRIKTASAAKKTNILIKKETIMQRLFQVLGQKSPRDLI